MTNDEKYTIYEQSLQKNGWTLEYYDKVGPDRQKIYSNTYLVDAIPDYQGEKFQIHVFLWGYEVYDISTEKDPDENEEKTSKEKKAIEFSKEPREVTYWEQVDLRTETMKDGTTEIEVTRTPINQLSQELQEACGRNAD